MKETKNTSNKDHLALLRMVDSYFSGAELFTEKKLEMLKQRIKRSIDTNPSVKL